MHRNYHQNQSNLYTVSHLLPIDNNSFWGLSGNKLYLYTQEEVKNEKGEVVQIKLKCEKQYKDMIDSGDNFCAMCYTDNHEMLCLVTQQGNLLLFQPESSEKSKKISLWKNKTWDATSVLYDKVYPLQVTAR